MIGYDPCEREELIYIGGPVPGPLVRCTRSSLLGARGAAGRVRRHAPRRDRLIVRKKDVPLRLYSGHAGWGSGQLEGELEAGGWLTTEATKDEIFADHESIWKSVTQRIGLEIMAPHLDEKLVPPDPSLN